MKKMMTTIFAAVAVAAIAAEFIAVDSTPRAISGKVAAIDVKCTNTTQSVAVKVARHVEGWTNYLDVVSQVVTNTAYFPTNGTWGVSNIVRTVVTTNGWKKALAISRDATNTIATLTCAGGFANTNLPSAVWLFPGDRIFTDTQGAAASVTVAVEK